MVLPSGNLLLDALPPAEWARMRRFFRKKTVNSGDIILQRGQRITETYWPCTAVISTVAHFEDDSMAEVALIGRYGVLGIEAITGGQKALHTRIVQIPGEVLVLPYDHFADFQRKSPTFGRLISHYAQAYVSQVIQSGACSAKHSADMRVARLLLSFLHASGATRLPLAQQFLADLLGLSRFAVGRILRQLARSRVIRLKRGEILITDQMALEGRTCECYRLVREEFLTLAHILQSTVAEYRS